MALTIKWAAGRGALLGAAAGLLAAVSFASDGAAQAPQRGQTVTERPRPDYDPLGVRVGAFRLFPALALSEKYDDNIFSEDTNTVDDFITVVSPSAVLSSDWGRHSLQLSGTLDKSYNADRSKEEYTDYSLGANGRLDVRRDTFLNAGLSYAKLHEDRGSPDDVNGSEPTEYTLLNPSIGAFNRWNRFSLRADVAMRKLDFDDVPTTTGTINNDDRDRTHYDMSLRAGYEIVPQYEAFVRFGYNIVNYDDAVDDSGVDRDSNGFDIVAGTRIDFTGVAFGDVFAGYRRQSYDDATLNTIKGPSFGGELTWNATGLTTFKASVSRTIEETTQTGASGFFANVFAVSVDHELLRNVLVGARLSYTLNDYKGISREDNEYRARVNGRYLLNRHLYVSLSYDYSERDSNVAGSDFTKNVVMLRLESQI